jgi:hypothetical protein
MKDIPLPGLERLLEVCGRLGLRADVAPPRHALPPVGTSAGGHSLDPVLAVVYARLGYAYIAEDMYVLRVDDRENQWEEQNQWWRESWQKRLRMPVVLFGGEASLAYYHATVPDLADEYGRQPVVRIDTYELDGPYAMPLASDVDRFFEAYSRYLEVLVATPGYEREGDSVLSFPWETPEVFARDERLVQLIRAGRFDPLMPGPEEQAWAAKVVAAANTRG